LLKPFNLLVLDEPTNHLDIISKDVLKKAVLAFDGTLIVVSHDRDFLTGLTDTTLEFRDKKLHKHLGDVQYFLEKRKLEDMRAVEMKSVAKKEKTKKVQAKTLSKEEKKAQRKLEKEVQNCERKIEKIEAEIASFELEMAKPAFFQQTDADEKVAAYKKMKNDLSHWMENWEKAQENLENFG